MHGTQPQTDICGGASSVHTFSKTGVRDCHLVFGVLGDWDVVCYFEISSSRSVNKESRLLFSSTILEMDDLVVSWCSAYRVGLEHLET